MPNQISPSSVLPLTLLIVALLSAGIAVWMVILSRWAHQRPLVRLRFRRPVPWNLFDSAVIFSAYFLLTAAVPSLFLDLLPPELKHPLPENQTRAFHAIVHLLESRQPEAMLLAVVLAVVVAPLSEELIFRVVLQGGIESVLFRRLRVPRGLRVGLPVVFPALVFAALHWNTAGEKYSLEFYIAILGGLAVGAIASVLFALGWLTLVRRASWSDLGIVPAAWKNDFLLGLLSFCAGAVPVYAVQLTLAAVLPRHIAPDPVGIFVFALIWGYLYRQTHRLGPSLVSHMMLNAVSLTAAALLL